VTHIFSSKPAGGKIFTKYIKAASAEGILCLCSDSDRNLYTLTTII
jgi:hypothetical protein